MLNKSDLHAKIAFNASCVAPALRSAHQDKLAHDVETCAQWSKIAVCTGCGTKYYAGSDYCKSRFCAICAKLRALAWLAKLVPLLQDYIARGYYVFMLNLTIKDQQSLAIGLTALRAAWRHMTHDDRASRNKFKQLNSGGVRSTEVKIGEGSGIWHPHIHALTIYKPPPNVFKVRQFDDYRQLWENAVRSAFNCVDGSDKLGSVDIRGIKALDGSKGLISAIIETFKYICKFQWLELPPDRINELVTETKGKHFIAAWGELYGLNKQVEELLNRSTEEELRGHVCAVCGCSEFELENLLTDLVGDQIEEFKD